MHWKTFNFLKPSLFFPSFFSVTGTNFVLRSDTFLLPLFTRSLGIFDFHPERSDTNTHGHYNFDLQRDRRFCIFKRKTLATQLKSKSCYKLESIAKSKEIADSLSSVYSCLLVARTSSLMCTQNMTFGNGSAKEGKSRKNKESELICCRWTYTVGRKQGVLSIVMSHIVKGGKV